MRPSLPLFALLFASSALFALALVLCGCHQEPTAAQLADERRCSVVDFKTDGSIGGRWNAATQTLAYSRPGADGAYQAFLADADGSHERQLSNVAWPSGRHQFVVDSSPVETGLHSPSLRCV